MYCVVIAVMLACWPIDEAKPKSVKIKIEQNIYCIRCTYAGHIPIKNYKNKQDKSTYIHTYLYIENKIIQ